MSPNIGNDPRISNMDVGIYQKYLWNDTKELNGKDLEKAKFDNVKVFFWRIAGLFLHGRWMSNQNVLNKIERDISKIDDVLKKMSISTDVLKNISENIEKTNRFVFKSHNKLFENVNKDKLGKIKSDLEKVEDNTINARINNILVDIFLIEKEPEKHHLGEFKKIKKEFNYLRRECRLNDLNTNLLVDVFKKFEGMDKIYKNKIKENGDNIDKEDDNKNDKKLNSFDENRPIKVKIGNEIRIISPKSFYIGEIDEDDSSGDF